MQLFGKYVNLVVLLLRVAVDCFFLYFQNPEVYILQFKLANGIFTVSEYFPESRKINSLTVSTASETKRSVTEYLVRARNPLS